MVLLGRTGNGKSATGNSILGRKAFEAKNKMSSVTKECKLQTRETGDRRILNVIDTPGLFDTNDDLSFISAEIGKCIQLVKDGLHAVLFVASCTRRFTAEEAKVIEMLQVLFGPKIVDYIVVVFTGGDTLEADETTLEEFLKDNPPKELEELLHKCRERMVLFNNIAVKEKKEEQVTILLKEIDEVITRNGGQPYTIDMFYKFQKLSAETSKLFIVSDEEIEAEWHKRNAELHKRNAELHEREAAEYKAAVKLQAMKIEEQEEMIRGTMGVIEEVIVEKLIEEKLTAILKNVIEENSKAADSKSSCAIL